jgi:hypothetical protein
MLRSLFLSQSRDLKFQISGEDIVMDSIVVKPGLASGKSSIPLTNLGLLLNLSVTGLLEIQPNILGGGRT